MNLSIIIPAFEERRKIAYDVKAASEFLASHGLAGEILVVDDGSTDDTATVAKSVAVDSGVKLKVIRYERNMGKGYAVRSGIRESQGDYTMFADSGLCVPYDSALQGLELIKSGVCEIAHGSRKLAHSRIHRPQAWQRRLTAKIFRWLVIYWLKIPAQLSDTQCGFKVYRGNVARELYAECATNGFLFDVEIILRALRKGYRIEEFPVDWTCDRDSRLSLTRSPKRILHELKALRNQFRRAARE